MVYEKTVPRAPISAMYRGPGSNVYDLPTTVGHVSHDPRSEKLKAPAFGFGIKHGKFTEDASPGPVHYPDVKTTRVGKDGTPHYSLYSRPQDPRCFNVPGPGAYSPEKAGASAHHMSPRYSFGSRTRLRASDKNPAPNNYSLPTLIGVTKESAKNQAPIYSLRSRPLVGSFSEDLQKTPGPGTYTTTEPNNYRNKQPLYSLGARRELPGDATRKPGPGAHSPERCCFSCGSKGWSFGIRHSQYVTPLIIDCDF